MTASIICEYCGVRLKALNRARHSKRCPTRHPRNDRRANSWSPRPPTEKVRSTSIYLNDQCGVTFVPPQGWAVVRSDNPFIASYESPRRNAGFHLMTLKTPLNWSTRLSDSDALSQLVFEGLCENWPDTKIVERKRITVEGFETIKIDMTFGDRYAPCRNRYAMIQVSNQNRLYAFIFYALAKYFPREETHFDGIVESFRILESPSKKPQSQLNSRTWDDIIEGEEAQLKFITSSQPRGEGKHWATPKKRRR